jgi:FAD synthase
MKTYFELTSSQVTSEPCVISMGLFDGMHRGHEFLLSKAQEVARLRQAKQVVITFSSLPRAAGKQIITTFHKRMLLEAFPIDILVELDFSQICTLSAADFLSIIQMMFPRQEWVVGDDFHFGVGRKGNAELLEKVTLVQPYSRENLSSTRIRERILEGDFEEASALLGRPYSIVFPFPQALTLHLQALCLPENFTLAPFVTVDGEKIAADVSMNEGACTICLKEEVTQQAQYIEISPVFKKEGVLESLL